MNRMQRQWHQMRGLLSLPRHWPGRSGRCGLPSTKTPMDCMHPSPFPTFPRPSPFRASPRPPKHAAASPSGPLRPEPEMAEGRGPGIPRAPPPPVFGLKPRDSEQAHCDQGGAGRCEGHGQGVSSSSASSDVTSGRYQNPPQILQNPKVPQSSQLSCHETAKTVLTFAGLAPRGKSRLGVRPQILCRALNSRALDFDDDFIGLKKNWTWMQQGKVVKGRPLVDGRPCFVRHAFRLHTEGTNPKCKARPSAPRVYHEDVEDAGGRS